MNAFLTEMKDDILLFDDLEGRMELLIDLGKKLVPFPDEYKRDEFKVQGCVSNVHIISTINPNGTLSFKGSSDALIVRGYVYILLQAVEGLNVQEFLEHAEEEITQFIEGAQLNVSMVNSRANAFGNIFKTLKKQVEALQ